MSLITKIGKLVVPKPATLAKLGLVKTEARSLCGGQRGTIDHLAIRNSVSGGLTTIGGRTENEDGLLLARRTKRGQEQIFMVVADGMGGYGNGEIASAFAINIMAQHFRAGKAGTFSFSDAIDNIANSLAQWKLYQQNADQMAGTTLVGALIDMPTNMLRLAHIGDSRAYLFRRGELMMLTLDHNLMPDFLTAALADGSYARSTLAGLKRLLGNDLVAAYQGLTPPFSPKLSSLLYQLGADYYDAPYQDMSGRPLFMSSIAKAIGVNDYKGADASYLGIALQEGDIVVLASDGLHDFCTYHQLAGAISSTQKGSPADIANAIYSSLTNMADNVTIAVHKHG